MLLGLPFAVASCFASTWVILHLFLAHEERMLPALAAHSQPLAVASAGCTSGGRPGFSRQEWYVMGVLLVLVVLWISEARHGISMAVVALLGALAVTFPNAKLISFKDALKGVEWNMLLFMAASMHMGEQLIATGAAEWVVQRAFGQAGVAGSHSPLILAALVAFISLLAHLLITSRTARSSVLVPIVVLIGAASGANPAALAFLSTAAAGFCLTLPISAKPVTMFANVEAPTFAARDLLRLSLVLLPLHFVLLLLFSLVIWPWLGMNLF
jgi:di/tricarboxylate transporter